MNQRGPVLVTGCSSGIGRATCERLIGHGHVVYASARDPRSIEDLAALGCRTLRLDVEDEQTMVEAVRVIDVETDGLSALVNNAGFGLYGPIECQSMDDVRHQFETNVFGLVRLTQLVLPQMRRKGAGRIVNISSVGGRMTFPGGAFYHASKFALEALSDALRLEVAPFGIQVVVVEPGPVRTRWTHTAASSIPLEQPGDDPGSDPYRAFNAAVTTMLLRHEAGPLSRFDATAEEIAKVIEHSITAARPRARYVVKISTKALVVLRALLPDRVYDLFMRWQFKLP